MSYIYLGKMGWGHKDGEPENGWFCHLVCYS